MIMPNDWPIKRCLGLSLVILLATWGLLGLAGAGLDVPGIKQIVGFIFLTFIPGILIIRILRIHDIDIIESLLYTVGLSLAFVIFSGLVANFALPAIGISRPISVFPIMITLTIFTLILLPVAFWRDKGFTATAMSRPFTTVPPSVLFLILVFLLTVLGALMVNFYQNNILLLISIGMVAGIVGLAVFGKFIDHKVYPLGIAIIAICFLYQTTLISPYLTGFDIHLEYYFARLIVENGYWDITNVHSYNSMLGITMLTPIYSLILNIDGAWVFKIITPFVFSLVPLTLFHVFRQQMSPRKAFLAAFFFMVAPTFFLEMIALVRQQIAEFFFVLFLLLLVDRRLGLSQRFVLSIIFSLFIIMTHYGLAGISLFYFVTGWLLIMVIRSGWGRRIWGWLTRKFGGLPPNLTSPRAFPLKVIGIIVAVYFISSLIYYGLVGSGGYIGFVISNVQSQTSAITSAFHQTTGEPAVLKIEEPVTPALEEPVTPALEEPVTPALEEPSGFFNFTTRAPLLQTALGLDFASASSQGKAFRIFQYIVQLLLVVGCIRLIFAPRKLRFTAEYIALIAGSALLLVATIFLPGFAEQMNATRFYHIALILLAPLFILGGEGIWTGMRALWHKTGTISVTEDNQVYLRFISLAVLIPYFLITSGFIFEVTKHEVIDRIDIPYSIALSSHQIDIGGVFNKQDGAGADWLRPRLNEEDAVYADLFGWLLLGYESAVAGDPVITEFRLVRISSWRPNIFDNRPLETPLLWGLSQVYQDNYLYFRTWNIANQKITYPAEIAGCRRSAGFNETGVNNLIKSGNRIYNNGGAQVLIN